MIRVGSPALSVFILKIEMEDDLAKSKKDQLYALIAPEVAALGYRCVDVDFEKVGRDWILTVYINTRSGVTLDDCELVSHRISDLLDEADPIEQSYLLEVSSPGIDRPFKTVADYEDHVDELIEVKLFAPVEGNKSYTALLNAASETGIEIRLEDEQLLQLTYDQIAKAAPHIEF